MSLPTVPREFVPDDAGVRVTSQATDLHVTVPDGSTYGGEPVTKVMWTLYHDHEVTLRCSLHSRDAMVAYNPTPVPAWVPRPPAAWFTLAAAMAAEAGLTTEPVESLPVVADAIAQAEADHHIAELARTWHALHRRHRAETEGHLRAAAWARQNRAYAGLIAGLDAEARS